MIECTEAEHRSQIVELDPIKKAVDKSSQEYDQQKSKLQQDLNGMRLYLLTHIPQQHKELSFWRDTLRKRLSNSLCGCKTADKLF